MATLKERIEQARAKGLAKAAEEAAQEDREEAEFWINLVADIAAWVVRDSP